MLSSAMLLLLWWLYCARSDHHHVLPGLDTEDVPGSLPSLGILEVVDLLDQEEVVHQEVLLHILLAGILVSVLCLVVMSSVLAWVLLTCEQEHLGRDLLDQLEHPWEVEDRDHSHSSQGTDQGSQSHHCSRARSSDHWEEQVVQCQVLRLLTFSASNSGLH